MDGFTYRDIFDTKGIEYIIVIGFLLLIIVFWTVINKPVKVKESFNTALGFLNDKILRIPKGIFYSKNHTWTYLKPEGYAKTGIDDLLVHLTGPVKVKQLLSTGDRIKKGDKIAEIYQEDKVLDITSTLSGEIASVNRQLEDDPMIINKDPYNKGWFIKIKPDNWIEETKEYILADSAPQWFYNEIQRFKDFIAGSGKQNSQDSSGMILQDGGELVDNPLAGLSSETWKEFQKSYLEA